MSTPVAITQRGICGCEHAHALCGPDCHGTDPARVKAQLTVEAINLDGESDHLAAIGSRLPKGRARGHIARALTELERARMALLEEE